MSETQSETPESQPNRGISALINHVSRNKVTFALWCTRLATILFTLNYLIPILGWVKETCCLNSPIKIFRFRYAPYNMYYKALLASAATSALRLHQRLPQVQLSREFFGLLFLEDSAHYLLYSVVFLYSPPLTCKLKSNISHVIIFISLQFDLFYRGLAASFPVWPFA